MTTKTTSKDLDLDSDSNSVLHPSLGQSGYLISYKPLSLFKTQIESQNDSIKPILVTVPPASIPTIFAHRQWRAGMILADLIHQKILNVKGFKVLELGAGTGLPGIISAKQQEVKNHQKQQVQGQEENDQEERVEVVEGGFTVITDYDEPSIVKTLKENVKRNLGNGNEELSKQRLKSNQSGGVRVLGHIWSRSIDDLLDSLPSSKSLNLKPASYSSSKSFTNSSSSSSLFDFILLADCLWDSLSHSDLLKTVTSTLSKTKESKIFIISGLHTGRDVLITFIRKASRLGFKLDSFSNNSKDFKNSFEFLEEEGIQTDLDPNDPLYQSKELILEVELSGKHELINEKKIGENKIVESDSKASLTGLKTPNKFSDPLISISNSIRESTSKLSLEGMKEVGNSNSNSNSKNSNSSSINSISVISESQRGIDGVDVGSSDVKDKSKHLLIEAHHHRLTGRRRNFVIEERNEERKEIGGVKERNRWITIWALSWKDEMIQ